MIDDQDVLLLPPVPPLEERGAPSGVAFLGVLLLLLAGVVAVIRFLAASPAERLGERVLAALALGGSIAVPGFVVALSSARPRLRFTAALLVALCSMGSLTGVLLPLVIPALLLLASYLRALPDAPRLRVPAGVIAALVPLLVALGLWLQFRTEDPRRWTTKDGRAIVTVDTDRFGPTYGSSTGDITTVPESASALVVILATGLLVTWASRPRRRPPVSPPSPAGTGRPAPATPLR